MTQLFNLSFLSQVYDLNGLNDQLVHNARAFSTNRRVYFRNERLHVKILNKCHLSYFSVTFLLDSTYLILILIILTDTFFFMSTPTNATSMSGQLFVTVLLSREIMLYTYKDIVLMPRC